MKIGIIALSLNPNAVPGFYNSQELGMGKALAAAGHTVIVYKLFSRSLLPSPNIGQVRDHLTFAQIPARSLGINGFFNKHLLDSSIDTLICFSDTQLYTKSVAKWCKLNNVQFYPYIGVIESASTSALKKCLMNTLTKRLIRFYRGQSDVWGKTPAVCEKLSALGIAQARLVPIGLDQELLYEDYRHADAAALRQAHDFPADAQILLFIGRLVPEKEPLALVSLFAKLHAQNPQFHLCMIGTGELENAVRKAVTEAGLADAVTLLPRVPNKEMWEFYCMSYCYVNLNHHEIYGMAILEAMYYECPVVAFRAPGPDFILDGGRFGRLCESDDDLVSAILAGVTTSTDSVVSIAPTFSPASMDSSCPDSPTSITAIARERVLSNFLWESCLPEL
ncbi:MAG: glycosyltransferase family 4 protein [bacterium]|nr:glycosyltransferase family 4 protein [bacterium]